MGSAFTISQIRQIEIIREWQQAQEATRTSAPAQAPLPPAAPSRALNGPNEGRGRIPGVRIISRAGNTASERARRGTDIARDTGDYNFGRRRPVQHKVLEPIDEHGPGKQHMVPEKVRRRRVVLDDLRQTRNLIMQTMRKKHALAHSVDKAGQAARRAVQEHLRLLTRFERELKRELEDARRRPA